MSNISRREFVAAAAAGLCVCAFCPSHGAPARRTSDPVDIGVPSDFAKDGVYDQWAREHKFFVIRRNGRLFASSAICTHEVKRLVVSLERDQIHCREHKAIFSLDGKVLRAKRGEEPKGPLPRFGIALTNGRIIVTPAKTFAERQWDDPGASVAVK